MSVPVALVGHSKAPPSLGHAAPHELGQGSVGTELCASVAGLWMWAGTLGCHRLGIHGSISPPLPP